MRKFQYIHIYVHTYTQLLQASSCDRAVRLAHRAAHVARDSMKAWYNLQITMMSCDITGTWDFSMKSSVPPVKLRKVSSVVILNGINRVAKRLVRMNVDVMGDQRDIYIHQKRHIHTSKETYIYIKRDVYIDQKRHIYTSKETYI